MKEKRSTKPLVKKTLRKKIPPDVMLKLWVLSGGRCEFPGCNKPVWRDGLTLREDNFAVVAHIIAAKKDGPRGDEVLSPKLEQSFDNLLLTCLDHGKLPDGKHKHDYSVEDLIAYKKVHEERIRMQTEIQPNMKTTVLKFAANIGDRPVKIDISETYQALLPRYPENERGINIDYTSSRPGRGDTSYWTSISYDLHNSVMYQLTPGNNIPRPGHLSIFALGPIPLLLQLGHSIGSTISADIYQRHRDTEDWKWKSEDDSPFNYTLREELGVGNNVAVVLSLSGKIHDSEIHKHFEQKPHIYEITIENPNTAFLSQKSRLEKFREQYRSVITKIRERHGPDSVIHLFPAIPAPIAVVCGRELLPKVDPSMLVYDFEREQGGFIQTLNINKQS